MAPRDGFSDLSVRRLWCGDAGHHKTQATQPKVLKNRRSVATGKRRRASATLDDEPHRLRLASYPALPGNDPYESLPALLGTR